MMVWSDDRIAELTRRWEAGETGGEIGKAMGISRNAVIGKAHRLNLQARAEAVPRKPAA